MPFFLLAMPFVLAGEVMVVGGLYLAMLPAAVYSALVPSRPQRVDGFLATREYEIENGLGER